MAGLQLIGQYSDLINNYIVLYSYMVVLNHTQLQPTHTAVYTCACTSQIFDKGKY